MMVDVLGQHRAIHGVPSRDRRSVGICRPRAAERVHYLAGLRVFNEDNSIGLHQLGWRSIDGNAEGRIVGLF